MLVNLYKSKTPVSLLSYPILVALCAAVIFLKTSIPDTAFFSWQEDLFSAIYNQPLISYLLVCLTLWLCGIRLNFIVNRFDFYSKNTYLPGVIFVILVLCLGNLRMNAEKVSLLFMILGLEHALFINRQESAIRSVFVSSFFLGIATVMTPTVLPILFLPWIALTIFRSFVWREWFVLFLGASIPWGYNFLIYYFVTGKWYIEYQSINFTDFSFSLSIYELSLLGIAVILGFAAFVNYVISARTGLLIFKKRSRFLYNTIVFSLMGALISLIFFSEIRAFFIVPMTIVISVYLLNLKQSLISNILLFSLLALAVSTFVLSS